MVRRGTFINKIRDLQYTYKRRQKRTELWRKRGGTHYIAMPMTDLLEDGYVLTTLGQAGCSEEEARRFVADHKISS
jgi:hypothetical protein